MKDKILITKELLKDFFEHFGDKNKIWSELEFFLREREIEPVKLSTTEPTEQTFGVRLTVGEFLKLKAMIDTFEVNHSKMSPENDYTREHNPCLSFNDICSLWSLGPEARGQLSELVNKKIQ